MFWNRRHRARTNIAEQKMRDEGIEPTTAGSGIQRSTTELIPQRAPRHTHSLDHMQTHFYAHNLRNTTHDAHEVHLAQACTIAPLDTQQRSTHTHRLALYNIVC